jgi:TonB family protein
MTSRLAALTVLALVFIGIGIERAAAQSLTIQQVKDLYAEAAYEDALGVLSKLPATESMTEAGRYRAACLIALGRPDEAQTAIAAIVQEHPEYRPDPSETSPRVIELFNATRRQLLPGIALRMYTDAKTTMDRKEAAEAIKGFETLIRVLDDPELKGDSKVSELAVLATGFLDLTRAKVAAATPPPVPAIPAAAGPPGKPPVITRAVAIRQTLPQWTPPDSLSRQAEFAGAVRIGIGEDGKVMTATMAKSVHPAYDRLLLAAAQEWLYEPARRDGVPVPSEHTVEVRLKPR